MLRGEDTPDKLGIFMIIQQIPKCGNYPRTSPDETLL
jgi:hypothetical protein